MKQMLSLQRLFLKEVIQVLIKLFFFTVQSAWQEWSVWRGGRVSVGQGMLKTTCAILMKLFASEQRLLTNIYVRTLL